MAKVLWISQHHQPMLQACAASKDRCSTQLALFMAPCDLTLSPFKKGFTVYRYVRVTVSYRMFLVLLLVYMFAPLPHLLTLAFTPTPPLCFHLLFSFASADRLCLASTQDSLALASHLLHLLLCSHPKACKIFCAFSLVLDCGLNSSRTTFELARYTSDPGYPYSSRTTSFQVL
jgi:hypothetical protein